MNTLIVDKLKGNEMIKYVFILWSISFIDTTLASFGIFFGVMEELNPILLYAYNIGGLTYFIATKFLMNLIAITSLYYLIKFAIDSKKITKIKAKKYYYSIVGLLLVILVPSYLAFLFL